MKQLNFGETIEALKDGYRVARSGWNGKGMYLFMQKGKIACETVELSKEDAEATIADNESVIDNIGGVPVSLFEGSEHGDCNVMPFIVMKNAQGDNVIGWLASQTDMFAEDWAILSTDEE